MRELRNLIERAMILTRGKTLEAEDFRGLDAEAGPEATGDGVRRWLAELPGRLDLRETLRGAEQLLIERALEAAEGVQAEAARRLGLSRSDLSYRLRRIGLPSRRPATPDV